MDSSAELFESTKQDISEQFFADSRPWVIAFSGGKDSTLVLQLVYEFMIEHAQEQLKPVFVITSDTMVEPPNVITYTHNVLNCIEQGAKKHNLPLTINWATPTVHERFWSKIIGKGYPPPTRWFRWCTSSMKIKPTKRVINKITREYGSVVLLLGTREDESSARKRRMEGRLYSERRLNPHHEIQNALVYSPIQYWTTDDVWEYLHLNNPAPWGQSHDIMIGLYKQANGGECPLIIDLNTPSCGGSRFGCWTCTVVKYDKSMEGFINTGDEWMMPLNTFRNWLKEIREDSIHRMDVRRNGEPGAGPFTPEAREEILIRLLEVEKELNLSFITDEEILYIQNIWTKEFDLGEKAIKIARRYGRELSGGTQMNLEDDDRDLLDSLTGEYELSPELVARILSLAEEFRHSYESWGAGGKIQARLEEIINTAIRQAELTGEKS